MNSYEKIINIMRNQGAVKNPIGLQLAEMTDATSCDVGELHLEAEDLLISQHLTDYEIKIDVEDNGKLNSTTTTVAQHRHDIDTFTSTETKIKVYGKLKKGDLVLVQRLSDEKYVIIEKLLEAADEN